MPTPQCSRGSSKSWLHYPQAKSAVRLVTLICRARGFGEFSWRQWQNRKAALPDQRDPNEDRIGFDGGEGDWMSEWAEDFEFDGDPARFVGGGIGEGGLGHLGDASDGLGPNAFVKEGPGRLGAWC